MSIDYFDSSRRIESNLLWKNRYTSLSKPNIENQVHIIRYRSEREELSYSRETNMGIHTSNQRIVTVNLQPIYQASAIQYCEFIPDKLMILHQ